MRRRRRSPRSSATDGLTALEAHLHSLLAVAHDLDLQPARDGVDAADAHAVQTAGDLVAVVVELAAGVQHGHHHLDGGLAGGVHGDGDAATVVADRDGVVLVNAHIDLVAVAGQGLVDGVVDRCTCHVCRVHIGSALSDPRRPVGFDLRRSP